MAAGERERERESSSCNTRRLAAKSPDCGDTCMVTRSGSDGARAVRAGLISNPDTLGRRRGRRRRRRNFHPDLPSSSDHPPPSLSLLPTRGLDRVRTGMRCGMFRGGGPISGLRGHRIPTHTIGSLVVGSADDVGVNVNTLHLLVDVSTVEPLLPLVGNRLINTFNVHVVTFSPQLRGSLIPR